MSKATITIKGIPELQAKFERIEPAVKRGVQAAGQYVHGKAKIYPPSTPANAPRQFVSGGRNTWYERGWGSKWAIKAGGWHGNKSSENLMAKWTFKTTNRGLTATIGNNASYAPYVQGADEQTRAMKVIGWKDVGTIAEEEAPRVENFIRGEIQKELNK